MPGGKNKAEKGGAVEKSYNTRAEDPDDDKDSGYGYEGSDNDASDGETERRVAAALDQRNPLRKAAGGDTSPPQRRRRFKITSAVDGSNLYLPPAALVNDQADDGILLCAGAYGFIQAFIFGALTPYFGIPHDVVMVGALAILLLWVVWLSFCPTRSLGSVGSSTPYGVFLAASCFGCLMGGVIAGANQYTHWPKLL